MGIAVRSAACCAVPDRPALLAGLLLQDCRTRKKCEAHQFTAFDGNATADRVCLPYSPPCTASEWEKQALTPTSDRICVKLQTCAVSKLKAYAAALPPSPPRSRSRSPPFRLRHDLHRLGSRCLTRPEPLFP